MDNSLAIHPNLYAAAGAATVWSDAGGLVAFARDGDWFRFEAERGSGAIAFYGEDTARVVYSPLGEPDFELNAHILADGAAPASGVAVEWREEEGRIVLSSSRLEVRIERSPLRIAFVDPATGEPLLPETGGMKFNARGEVACFKAMDARDRFYGFGEKAGFLDKRGERLTMWNTDVYAPHNPETQELYVSIPYYMTLRGGRAFGLFFFNTHRTEFNLRGEDDYYFRAEGGQLDYFFFAGPAPKDVVAQYTALTGRMPLPPRWTLGYQQSRYSYETADEVREMVRRFRAGGIPLDVVYLDIHYMYGYRVFTFDPERFPDPGGLIAELRALGVRVVPIVDPGVKADPAYRVFRDGVRQGRFCKYLDGQLFYGQVWPERSAFPDFTDEAVRAWWGDEHRYYAELGVEGIWNDMNEPSVFNESKTMDLDVMHDNDGRPATHRELHNTYGYQMSRATYEGMKRQLGGRRPFVLTRAGFAGIQRYAAVWTGDNRSFWEHLELCVPMCLNLGLSGVALCGADVGGFAHDSHGELLERWSQLGAFMPFYRNHSEMKSIRQEPWSFGARTEQVVRRYVQLRYRWLPYLYSLFAEASRTGIPAMRPLLLEYPDDERAQAASDQFMLGGSVLVAPVVRPRTDTRLVYLPAGGWVNYWTEERLEGGRYVIADAPHDIIPLFVKEGAILPLASDRLSTEESPQTLELHVYPPRAGDTSVFDLYEDDGTTFDYEQNRSYEERIAASASADAEREVAGESASLLLRIDTALLLDGYAPDWRERTLVVHAGAADVAVELNGKRLAGGTADEAAGTLTFRLQETDSQS
ncbi:glycoside hydrolase family 31 protein [Cohnella sp. 56]|uniref:glycoside hydrolase family 31 protein n=1 Tax=Cohnella sp. 56 TaxID=3113722 RepID=UPI0030E8CE8A